MTCRVPLFICELKLFATTLHEHATSLSFDSYFSVFAPSETHNWLMPLLWHAAYQGWHVLLADTLVHACTKIPNSPFSARFPPGESLLKLNLCGLKIPAGHVRQRLDGGDNKYKGEEGRVAVTGEERRRRGGRKKREDGICLPF